MRVITGSELRTVLHFRMLIERLRQAFRAGCETPSQFSHGVPTYGGRDATLKIVPAWIRGRWIGVRVVAEFPDNDPQVLGSVQGAYLLLDGRTGVPQALLDGPALTVRQTAATSALAASYLARPDSERLLVVGAGPLATPLIEAHATVLPLREVLVWAPHRDDAERVASRFRRGRFKVSATPDLEGAVRGAHVVSCTSSPGNTPGEPSPLRGEWLAPGTHLDFIGGAECNRREADSEAVSRSRVFVDARDGAWADSGILAQSVAAGHLIPDDIAGDLFDLTRGERSGRRFYDQITLFNTTGTAVSDLAAAELAVEMILHNESLR